MLARLLSHKLTGWAQSGGPHLQVPVMCHAAVMCHLAECLQAPLHVGCVVTLPSVSVQHYAQANGAWQGLRAQINTTCHSLFAQGWANVNYYDDRHLMGFNIDEISSQADSSMLQSRR